ncbi:hypothetical protein B484DRAFT_392805, partial [Ochromonadaceae sp. CCMP2298]
VSLKVALAIALAAAYGILERRPQPALAAFTIAYLSGGAVSGINVMTSINRAVGTAVACVYVILVVFIIDDWSSPIARHLVIGGAAVAFQLPATYCRTYPLYSYSGTVAGFTVVLLLIDPEVDTDLSVNRIIDTYVGVAIYLVVEFALFATFTEAQLVAD